MGRRAEVRVGRKRTIAKEGEGNSVKGKIVKVCEKEKRKMRRGECKKKWQT
jgi:hypothetical protein